MFSRGHVPDSQLSTWSQSHPQPDTVATRGLAADQKATRQDASRYCGLGSVRSVSALGGSLAWIPAQFQRADGRGRHRADTQLLNEYSDHEVNIYEKADYPGGHTHTVTFNRESLQGLCPQTHEGVGGSNEQAMASQAAKSTRQNTFLRCSAKTDNQGLHRTQSTYIPQLPSIPAAAQDPFAQDRDDIFGIERSGRVRMGWRWTCRTLLPADQLVSWRNSRLRRLH